MKTKQLHTKTGKGLRCKSHLLLMAFFVTCFAFTKAQTMGSGIHLLTPTTGTVVNSRCDLHFCVTDSFAQSNFTNSFYIGTSMSYSLGLPSTNVAGSYNGGFYSTAGPNGSVCVYPRDWFAISPGIHTFYLGYSTLGVQDSITLNIQNYITPLCADITYSTSPIGTSGGQQLVTFTNNNFNNMPFNVNINNTNLFIPPAGTNTVILTYPNNGTYSFTYTAKAIGTCAELNDPTNTECQMTGVDSVSNGCSSSAHAGLMTVYSQSGCINDSVTAFASDIMYYVNGVLDSSGTANLSTTIEWGDGQTQTFNLNWFVGFYGLDSTNVKHLYSTPGTYTYKIKLNGAVCNDSIIGSFTVNPCGNLIGTVYYDANNDCNQNSGELGIANIPVTATLGANVYMAWTDNLGNYAFGNIPAGNYLIQINGASAGYTITCGNSLPHITNVSTTGTTVENFALYFDPATCNDFDIATAWWASGLGVHGTFFPGDEAIITPEVGVINAACTQTITGKVKIILDPCLTYTGPGFIPSIHGAPDYTVSAPGGDTLIWNVANINNIGDFYYWNYGAAVTTCTNAQVGDSVCITVIVTPTSGDANPSNNIATHCFAVGVSYDPNFKEVTPKGIGAQGNIPQNTNELTYTLHFQNTGTATAHNIYLLDTISTALDLESIEIVASSHPMHPYLLPNRTMKFMFANIMLADSTHDEAHSHGYVTYRIKPNANLPFGTQIKNRGHIYFDYNEPVATNTTLNTIAAMPTSIKELATNGLVSIYPNPAKDKLTVSIANNENSVITITDILGKEVMQQKASGLQTELNISDLNSGVYFVKVNNQGIILKNGW